MEKYKNRDLFVHILPEYLLRKKTKELVGRNFLTDQCYEHENRKCCIFTMEWKIVFKNGKRKWRY